MGDRKEIEDQPKKRLRGKQAPGYADAPVVDTLAASKPTPKKRLRGKQAVDAPVASPKMAKPKARPQKKGGPRAQQFMDVMKKHFRENAGAINLA